MKCHVNNIRNIYNKSLVIMEIDFKIMNKSLSDNFFLNSFLFLINYLKK